MVRNPLDMAWSMYQMSHTNTHTERVQGMERFSRRHRPELQQYARDWVLHAQYWGTDAKLQIHSVRYEDLRMHTLSTLMGVLAFLLPPDDLPSMEQVTCSLEQDPSKVRSVWTS